MILKDKTAIVTGAASGIGRATAVRFAREGANVALVDMNAAGLAEAEAACGETGAKSLVLERDAADPGVMDALVAETARAFGGIDILVNTIVHRVRGKFLDITIEEFRRVLEVNVTSYYFLTQKVVPHMIERGGGSVIHISSQLGFVVIPEYSPYCTSKGAVVNMTRALATELGPHGIRVNCLAPGTTVTDRVQKIHDNRPGYAESKLENISVKRFATPEEMAGVALFMVSGENDFMNGAIVTSDGGTTAA